MLPISQGLSGRSVVVSGFAFESWPERGRGGRDRRRGTWRLLGRRAAICKVSGHSQKQERSSSR
jgi:hypothetical protein